MYARLSCHYLLRRSSLARSLTAIAALLFGSPQGNAALLRACRPTDSPLLCRLESLLTLLYAAAAVMGLLLIVAVLAAVRAYRRKGRKITPDEVTPDAP